MKNKEKNSYFLISIILYVENSRELKAMKIHFSRKIKMKYSQRFL
jgi:hypothetical protein